MDENVSKAACWWTVKNQHEIIWGPTATDFLTNKIFQTSLYKNVYVTCTST